MIRGEDFRFSIEYDNSPNIIIVSVIFEKLPFDDFKMFFIEKILKKIKRLNQSMSFIFSDFYWKTHSIDETIQYLRPYKIKMADLSIESKEKLIKEFIEKGFGKHMKFDKPLWRIIYCENYENEKSMLMMKFHHVLADGGSLLSLLSSFSNESIVTKQIII